MITAHGGALKTGRNTKRYFKTMANYDMEAVEVDIRKKDGFLYLGHTHVPFIKRNRVPLSYAFEFCEKYNKRINCDVKEKGIVKDVQKLAEEMGVQHLVYFTGSVMPEEIKDLGECEAYVNTLFYTDKFSLTVENLPKIKEYLDSFNAKGLKGININYLLTNEELWNKAFEIGLGVSIFTVDIEKSLKKIIKLPFDNVTTNKVDIALKERQA
ncbi:MAG: hypothetical protein J6V83_03375 [Clostridia bacterium]|nr:hypothetical protein [Clostridia bacterium]